MTDYLKNSELEKIVLDLELNVESILTNFSRQDDFTEIIQQTFGDEIELHKLAELHQQWSNGEFDAFPKIEILHASEINNANGAYSQDTKTIYLSSEFISQNSLKASQELLLEEYGHYVDDYLQAVDTLGDEGAIFSALVLGKELNVSQLQQLNQEEDRATIDLDGETIAIEQSTSISDSGGFEGSQETITLESTDGGTATFFYEHYTIPDNFIIRYEGKNLVQTGFVGGSRTGTVNIPAGDSDQLEVIVTTNDEGTAWDYTVTAETEEDCADTGIFNIELSGGEFEDTDDDGDCEGSGTVYVGRKDGTNRLIRIDNATVEFEKGELRVLDGTVFSDIGGVSEPLFSGNFVLDLKTGATKSLTDTREQNQFQFGDLVDIDFTGLQINRNNIGLTGDFTLPVDLGEVEIGLDGIPNSLIVDGNGARLGGGKISFPREEFRFLEEKFPPGLFDVDAKNLSVEYVSANDLLRFQGKLALKSFLTKNEAGNLAPGNVDVEFDFAGNNYIGIKNSELEVVGSASVKNIKLPGGWGLSELGVSINTVSSEIKGNTKIDLPIPTRFPIPAAFGGQQLSGPSVGLEAGFLLPPPDLKVDSVKADVDKLNIPIGTSGFYFQRLAGSVSNIAKTDPVRFGGGVGFSLGPVVTLPIPSLARDLLGLPSSIDAATVNLSLDVDSDFDSSIAGNGEVSVISPSLFKIQGAAEYNWDKDFATGKGSFNVIGDLIAGQANSRFDLDRGNFDGAGDVTLKVPDAKLFGIFKDKTLGSAKTQFQYRNDNNTRNDFVNSWGEINLGSINIPLIGQIDLGAVDVGVRYYFTDGEIDLLGDELPLLASWNVPADREWVMMGADWENTNNDVRVRVIDPDGNVYQESEFAQNGIAIVEDLTDDKTRTVVVGQPSPGIWDVEVIDTTGLGEVNYSAFGATDAPEVSILTPDEDIPGGLVNIDFEAFDSDSEAEISLFYDTNNADFDGAFIGKVSEDDGASSFEWNTRGIATGEYYVYAIAMDDTGVPIFSNYSAGKVIISEETDLAITQTASSDLVEFGKPLTYNIEVTNNGTVANDNVIVTETLDGNFTLIDSSIAPATQTDNEVTFELDNLAAGETKTLEIEVNAPTEGETLIATGYVEGDVFDFDASNDTSTVATTIEPLQVQQPDLSVTRNGNASSINLGEQINYSFTVTNNGDINATDVLLTEYLSAGDLVSGSVGETVNANLVDIVQFQLDMGDRATIDIDATDLGSNIDSYLRLFDADGNELAASDDDIAPGENSSVDSYLEFEATDSGIYYVGISDLSYPNYDPTSDNNIPVSTQSGFYELEITVGNDNTVNDRILSEPNNTIAEASDSGLSSASPGIFKASGMLETADDFAVSFFDDTVTANIGTLEPGASTEVNLSLNSSVAGELITTTEVTSAENDLNINDNSLINTTNVRAVNPNAADLEISQDISNANPAVGDTITITLTVTNNGPGIASEIEILDLLPQELSFVSAFPEQGTYDNETGIWDVGNVRDNLSRNLTIEAQVNSLGFISNTAEITAVNETDPDSIPNNQVVDEDDFTSTTINSIDPNITSTLSLADVSATEGNNLVFTVDLSEPSTDKISVDYATEDLSAISGEDYTAISGTLEFAPGETSKTIEVSILEDNQFEADEALAINFSNPVGVNFSNAEAIGTIANEAVDPLVETVDDNSAASLSNTDDSYIYKSNSYYYDFFAPSTVENIDAGDIVTIDLTATDFDPVLMILDADGNVVEYQDNITADNTDASLTFAVGEEESFFISVESKNANDLGDYNLTVDTIDLGVSGLENNTNLDLSDRSVLKIDSLATIDSLTGSLVDTDAAEEIEIIEDDNSEVSFGVFEDYYLLTGGEVGQQIQVGLQSDSFDGAISILEIDDTGDAKPLVSRIDEVLGVSTNEVSELTIKADTNYLIGVTGGIDDLDAVKLGDYTLTTQLI